MDEAREPLERAIEGAFEELVELVLRGESPDLEAFLADRPELDATSRERLRVRARVLVGEPAAARLPFERVGEFRLVRKLGEGGMGVVYLARQESLGRLLALKVMRPELVGAANAERRFEREARAIAQLRHPGIVTVHAAGEHDGVHWLALEYIEGQSLDELLRAEGRIAPARAVRWARELAEALAYAHGAGVVHRDVKPSNVRINSRADARADGSERALLLDFGLAQLADASALTASGSFRGTPYYASPEQVEGRAVDARTDVYSLGATLYQCLTGVPPFEGATSAQVFHAILAREPRRPRALAPEIARDLETVVLTAMEKDPTRRYASASAFAEDLDALLAMRPIRARPQGALTRVVKLARRNRGASVAAAVAAVAVLAALGFVLRERLATERRFDAELELAKTASAAGDHDSALRALERALSLRPGDGGVLAEREHVRRAAAAAEAQASIARARTALAGYRDDDARLAELGAAALPLRQAVTTRPMSAEESARLLGLEEELAALGRARESRFAEVLEALNLARGLDPESEDGEAVLAELYLERWRAATKAHDARGERHYRELVEEHDHANRHADELHATVALTLASTPAGAEVPFPLVAQSGDVVTVLDPSGDPDVTPYVSGYLSE